MSANFTLSENVQIPTNDSRDWINKNVNLDDRKSDKKPCLNCVHFDNTKHVNDSRTKHAGICQKWCQVTFNNHTCKDHTLTALPDLKKEIKEQLTQQQFTFPL